PFGLLAFGAELIQLIASSLKNEQTMPKLLEVGERLLVDLKCVRRKQPLFLGEETLFGKSGANCRQPLVLNPRLHYETNVQRSTLNVHCRITRILQVVSARRRSWDGV